MNEVKIEWDDMTVEELNNLETQDIWKARPFLKEFIERHSDTAENAECIFKKIDEYHKESIAYRDAYLKEKVRWSWDIVDGTDGWCVQIWFGDTLLDSITRKSDDGGMVKLANALQALDNLK